jgi:drug/metabolite transporter (DMT)-like permease
LLFLAWFCTVWAFQLSAYALKYISAFTVNLSYNLEPVYGILLAFLVYKENKYLGWNFYMGVVIILLAVSLQMLRVYKAKTR